MTKQAKKKGRPANYGGASPRKVAEALLRYRPGKPPRPISRKPEPVKS